MGGECCGALAVSIPEAVCVAVVSMLEGSPGEACAGVHRIVLIGYCSFVH